MTQNAQGDEDDHFLHSSLREGLIEHLFIGEIMRRLWLAGIRDIEVLHAQTDARGYDVVLCANGFMRHIQLKASKQGATTARQSINVSLAQQPSGCVVWIMFDPKTLILGPFLWFGGPPGAALPDLGAKLARHTKADAKGFKKDRPNGRQLAKGQFERVADFDSLISRLFGASY